MNTPTLPELPEPAILADMTGRYVLTYTADQMRAYALAALSSALPQPDSGHQAQQPNSTPAATADSARLRWLHAPGSNDVDGYEWGIYRVKWTHGKAVEVWQTNADFSDLDAAIAKAERSADTPAGTPEPSKTGERP